MKRKMKEKKNWKKKEGGGKEKINKK